MNTIADFLVWRKEYLFNDEIAQGSKRYSVSVLSPTLSTTRFTPY